MDNPETKCTLENNVEASMDNPETKTTLSYVHAFYMYLRE